MKKIIKYSISIVAAILICFIIYSFLYGKLFPYSPVIIGFSENKIKNATIYIQNGATFSDFEKIDSLFPLIEAFFEMQFIDNPRIFIFKDTESYYQRSLTRARFCSFYNGDIVIAPWALEEAKNGKLSLEIYLKHELSHSLIHQQSGLIHAYKFPKWLHEGTAMYIAKQMGTTLYPSKEETYQYICNGNFLHPKYYQSKQRNKIELTVNHRIGFIYSEFACIVDYLIEQYGKDKFLSFLKRVIKNRRHDPAFIDTYGIEFNQFIEDFKNIIVRQAYENENGSRKENI